MGFGESSPKVVQAAFGCWVLARCSVEQDLLRRLHYIGQDIGSVGHVSQIRFGVLRRLGGTGLSISDGFSKVSNTSKVSRAY